MKFLLWQELQMRMHEHAQCVCIEYVCVCRSNDTSASPMELTMQSHECAVVKSVIHSFIHSKYLNEHFTQFLMEKRNILTNLIKVSPKILMTTLFFFFSSHFNEWMTSEMRDKLTHSELQVNTIKVENAYKDRKYKRSITTIEHRNSFKKKEKIERYTWNMMECFEYHFTIYSNLKYFKCISTSFQAFICIFFLPSHLCDSRIFHTFVIKE